MKRNENLVPLSRDHHFGLLCCWKIRIGVKKEISYERIKAYVNFFWNEKLSKHFDIENFVFDAFRSDLNFLKMEQEHEQIIHLIYLMNQSENNDLFIQFADLLEKHIRFEERDFFQDLQLKLSEIELNKIGEKLHEFVSEGNDFYPDEFWLMNN